MKVVVTTTEVSAFLLQVFSHWRVGYVGASDIRAHISYSLFHANVFHLLVNLVCLWSIRGKVRTLPAFMVAVLASYLPQFCDEPTVGLSGWLFAVFGIMWGEYKHFLQMLKVCLPYVVLTILLPGINGWLHLWCLLLGYLVGRALALRA